MTKAETITVGSPASTPSSSVLSAITVALPGLREGDRRVIESILADPQHALTSSVAELARRARVAPSTVIHACQALGFDGFQTLRLALAEDIGRSDGRPSLPTLPEEPTRQQILHHVLHMSAYALTSAVTTVDPSSFERAVDLLMHANQILVLGSGNSRAPAEDAAYRLASIGLPHTHAPADSFAQHRAARLLGKGDVCVAISYSGVTRDTVEGAQLAAQGGADVIAITGYRRTPLTATAAVALVAGAPVHAYQLGAMHSRIVHLAVIDALYTALAIESGARAARALEALAETTTQHLY